MAVYVDADADAWFVREADEAICLGSTTYLDPADGHRKSRYLDEPGVVAALVQAEVDAVWVGWGFVSERASFAQRCEEAGIIFVGPDSATIRLLGDKVTAKRMAEKADVPVVPWSGGPVDDVAQAAEEAERLGYPVVLKATAGGGGRGIRVVRHPRTWRQRSRPPAARPSWPSVTRPCSSRPSSRRPATSRSRSSPTTTAPSGRSASATAASSGATRR